MYAGKILMATIGSSLSIIIFLKGEVFALSHFISGEKTL